MHELSLAQEMVEQLEDAAQREKAQRILHVVAAIGPYSGVEPDAFEFAFPFAAEGTLAEGAKLTVQVCPVSVVCHACGASSNPDPAYLACSRCTSTDVEITGGCEFLVKSIELEIP